MLAVIAVVGCKGGPDADGDGFAQSADCNDADALRFPGAPELCDLIDQDCDDVVDESPMDGSIWFADNDLDTFGAQDSGAQDSTVSACAAPQGYVANALDCDDSDSAINPNMREVCGGPDEDCDYLVDESGAIGELFGWLDSDGDGQGAPGSFVQACTLPANATNNADDCDDNDPTVYSGAPETWYDNVDSDCGNDDDFDADRDGFQGGADGDDCYDDDPAANPNAVEICNNGLDDNCDGSYGDCGLSGTHDATARADAVIEVSAQTSGGGSIVIDDLGDMDGGGSADLLVGVYRAGVGTVYVLTSPLSTTSSLDSAYAQVLGEGIDYNFGDAAVSLGDVDLDGWPDFAVHSDAYADVPHEHAVWIVHGPVVGSHSISDVGVPLVGERYNDQAGYGMDAGLDASGDGMPDLLIGAQGADYGGEYSGATYLVTSYPQGPISLSTANSKFFGEALQDFAGRSVALINDADGDGLAEIAIGARGNDRGGVDAGVVYVFFPPTSGNLAMADADLIFTGEASEDFAGWIIGNAGDMDGDGRGELLMCAPGNDQGENFAGTIYIVEPLIHTNLSQVTNRLVGTGYYDAVGTFATGDMNGDEVIDVAVGSSTAPAFVGPGRAWLVLGPVSGVIDLDNDAVALINGDDAGDHLGETIAIPGDVNSDGVDDLLIAAPRAEVGNGQSDGEIYAYFGGGY